MKEAKKFVVVTEHEGSLIALGYFDEYEQAFEAVSKAEATGTKANIRSDGMEFWKKANSSPGTKDDEMDALVGAEDTTPKRLERKLLSDEPPVRLTEFAEKLEIVSENGARDRVEYQFIPNEPMRPHGLLFWGSVDAKVLSIKIADEEQLAVNNPISIRFFLNSYASFEALEYWVKHKVKLQYTNLPLMTMNLGAKLVVVVDKPCTICVCGMKQC